MDDLRDWTWHELNRRIMALDEKACRELLTAESKGMKRELFVRRIQSRLNKFENDARRERRRAELEKISG